MRHIEERLVKSMLWETKYNPCGDVWQLRFPPQLMNTETEEFSKFETMAVVLAEAIENWLDAD